MLNPFTGCAGNHRVISAIPYYLTFYASVTRWGFFYFCCAPATELSTVPDSNGNQSVSVIAVLAQTFRRLCVKMSCAFVNGYDQSK